MLFNALYILAQGGVANSIQEVEAFLKIAQFKVIIGQEVIHFVALGPGAVARQQLTEHQVAVVVPLHFIGRKCVVEVRQWRVLIISIFRGNVRKLLHGRFVFLLPKKAHPFHKLSFGLVKDLSLGTYRNE